MITNLISKLSCELLQITKILKRCLNGKTTDNSSLQLAQMTQITKIRLRISQTREYYTWHKLINGNEFLFLL